ncbi:hypothetical protein BHM03_00044508, partial [Ensete ventricosum]
RERERAGIHHRLHRLKEPYRSEAVHRDKVHFAVSNWVSGNPEKLRESCSASSLDPSHAPSKPVRTLGRSSIPRFI